MAVPRVHLGGDVDMLPHTRLGEDSWEASADSTMIYWVELRGRIYTGLRVGRGVGIPKSLAGLR